jgi:hypothetical protein
LWPECGTRFRYGVFQERKPDAVDNVWLKSQPKADGEISRRQVLTASRHKYYIPGIGAPSAPRCDSAPSKLLIDTVKRLPIGVGGWGFDGSPACRRRDFRIPGCLTGESEERETWTAESLRTVAAMRENLVAVRSRKRLRRSTFQVNTMNVPVSNHRNGQSGTSSEWRHASVVTCET